MTHVKRILDRACNPLNQSFMMAEMESRKEEAARNDRPFSVFMGWHALGFAAERNRFSKLQDTPAMNKESNLFPSFHTRQFANSAGSTIWFRSESVAFLMSTHSAIARASKTWRPNKESLTSATPPTPPRAPSSHRDTSRSRVYRATNSIRHLCPS